MGTITAFEDLDIWKKARLIYQTVITLCQKEAIQKDYRFCSQIKAAAGSVMDNIAEGFERDSRLEFVNFLSIAKGSCGEVRSQSFRGLDENYFTEDEHLHLSSECQVLGKSIANFIRYLNTSNIKGQKFLGRH